MSEPEFVFPQVHISRIVEEEDGELYQEAITPPICDFCADVRVTWEYRTDRYVIEEIGFATAEEWAACDECSLLIEKRLLPDLTLRMLRSWAAAGQKVGPQQIDAAGIMAQSFFDHLRSDRIAFG